MRKYIIILILLFFNTVCFGQDVSSGQVDAIYQKILVLVNDGKFEEAQSSYHDIRHSLDSQKNDLLYSIINIGLSAIGKRIDDESTIASIKRQISFCSEHKEDLKNVNKPTNVMFFLNAYISYLGKIKNPYYMEVYRVLKDTWPKIKNDYATIYIKIIENTALCLYGAESRYKEAIPVLEELLDLHKQGYQLTSKPYDLYNLLGICYQYSGDDNKAAMAYDYALINFTSTDKIENNNSYMTITRNRFDMAFKLSQLSKCKELGVILINYYKNRVDKKEDYINVLMELGDIELATFQYKEGLTHYEEGIGEILESNNYNDTVKKQWLENLYTLYNTIDISEKYRKYKSEFVKYNINITHKLNADIVDDHYIDSLKNRINIIGNDFVLDIKRYIEDIVTISNYYEGRHQDKNSIDLLEETIFKCKANNIKEQDYASLFCSLGTIYGNLHNIKKALENHKKAKYIYTRNGLLNSDFISILCHLSSDYRYSGDLGLAKAYLDEAWNVSLSMDGFKKDKNNYYNLLNEFSQFYSSLGNEQKALEYNSMILEDISEKDNSIVFKKLYQLARLQLLLSLNKYVEARLLLSEIDEQFIDETGAWWNAFETKFFNNDSSCTYDLEKWTSNDRDQIKQSYSSIQSDILKNYWNIYGSNLNSAYSMALNKFRTSSLKTSTYNNMLFTKNFQLELNKFHLSHPNKQLTPEIINNIINKIGNVDKIRKKLAGNEIAIEYFVIDNRKSYKELEKKYGALILKKDSQEPIFVELCFCDSLDQLVYKNTIDEAEIYADNLYDIRNNTIYKMIWEPLEKEIPLKSRVYVSGCGATYYLNLSAISNGRVRLDSLYDIHNVMSTTAILSEKSSNKDYNSAVIFGGIDYDTSMDEMALEATRYAHEESSEDYAMLRGLNERGSWGKLKYSLEEANKISNILSGNNMFVTTHTKSNASEEAFKALSATSPDIIHVSTHGYYYQPYMHSFRTDYSNKYFTGDNSDRHNYNGLLFSGANNAWKRNQFQNNVEDGILTAKEIYSLNLSSTKLLTLSACQTGLGETNDVNENEGLLRAFKVAGVDKILMTLWNISDDATSTFMVKFYENLIEIKDPRDALKKTIMIIKNEMPDPYYWAPFVLVE